MKICSRCRVPKEVSGFYKQSNGTLWSSCKACAAKQKREYQQSSAGKLVKHNYYLKNRDLYMERAVSRAKRIPYKKQTELRKLRSCAKDAVRRAIDTGTIQKPTNCLDCLKAKRLQAHHYISYEKENWLRVVFLCSACHGVRHRLGSKPARGSKIV